ncbi:MAG TPA: hypothetical protein H9986_07205 [Candidatus Prevotella stercoripullorum]|nr:hypothetical protein [Candidatus Prevotella stercoripullorum]
MNKIFNYCILSLLSVLPLTLGSCTEEYDYVKQKAKGQQVYFSNSLSSSVTITDNGAHFIVPINRIDTSEELTVNLTATDESGVLTIPSTVTFKAGESEANITIDYDPSQIEADTYYDVTLAVADADYTTPYGDSNYSFNIVMWPPYTVIGTGKFTDASIGISNYNIEIRQINSNPNKFRVIRPYELAAGAAGPDFIQFEIMQQGSKYPSGAQVTEPDMVYFDDIVLGIDRFNIGSSTEYWHPSNLKDMDVTHNRVIAYQDSGLPGVVQFAPYMFAYETEDGRVAGNNSLVSQDGVITITFPDYVYNPKDYTVSVNYVGALVGQDGNNYVMSNVTMGEDVTEVRVGIVEGGDVNNALNQVLSGQVDMTTVTTSGEVRIPCTYSGECTMVAVAYAYNDEGVLTEQNVAYTTFDFAVTAETWKPLGTGLYTDYMAASMYQGGVAVTYEVEIEESEKNPGIYRIINPYDPSIYPLSASLEYSYTPSNIIINASDPDAVYIQMQSIGVYDQQYGDTYILSNGGGYIDAGNPFDIVKQAGLIKGTLKNGVISFEPNELLFTDESSWAQGYIYYADEQNTTDMLVLPSAVTSQAKAKAVKAANTVKNIKFATGRKTSMADKFNKSNKFKAVKKFTLNKAEKMNRK